jgi:hypothetical protein
MIDGDDCGANSGLNGWQGKPKYSEEIGPNAVLSTTDPTCLGPGSNPVLSRGKPATDHLSYGTAKNVRNFDFDVGRPASEGNFHLKLRMLN